MTNNIGYSSPLSSSSSPHNNWLAFSLSNNLNRNPNINLPSSASSSSSSSTDHHTSHLSLFQAFNTNPGETVSAQLQRQDDAPATVPAAAGGGAAVVLSVFPGGPKLEDFLGGPTRTTTASHAPNLQLLSSGFSPETASCTADIYDSELKTIAASFLRGFSGSTEQTSDASKTQQQKQQQPLVVSEASAPKKNVETFGQRTSIYRGVTRHRWTGRYEAHLWDNSCRREGQNRKGRQGGYDKEEKAARAYDLAALKYWGSSTTTNFPVSNYEKELEEMKNMTRQEFVASLRRKSSGFSRGASIYRGVTRHHQHGRWQARIGRVAGNKDLYLGTFSTQEEAAEAYDIAAIKFRGLNAVTNFDISRYDVKSIATCNLPIGGLMPNKSKPSSDLSPASSEALPPSTSSLTFNAGAPVCNSLGLPVTIFPVKQDRYDHYWSSILGLQANTKNPSNGNLAAVTVGSNLENPTGFSLDFNAPNGVIHEGNSSFGLLVDGEQYNGNSTSGVTSAIPLATPIGNSNGEEGYVGNNNWINISHSYQTAKSNLSVLQTPIFGIE